MRLRRLLVAAGSAVVAFGVVTVARLVEEFAGPVRSAADAVGVLALTLVVVGAFVYVDVVSLETITALAVGGVVAVVAFVAGWLDGRRRDDQSTA